MSAHLLLIINNEYDDDDGPPRRAVSSIVSLYIHQHSRRRKIADEYKLEK